MGRGVIRLRRITRYCSQPAVSVSTVRGAEREYADRPDIFSADVLAWARLKMRRLPEALKLSRK